VCRAVEHAVEWGLARRDLNEVTAVGVHEIACHHGPTYLTLVYDISGETRRLLAVAEERTEESLRSCLRELGRSVCYGVKFACSDMWKPYLNVIVGRMPQAVHVLDRFHVMQQFGTRSMTSERPRRNGLKRMAMSRS
jgi:transposase